jgi:hypothetical protein
MSPSWVTHTVRETGLHSKKRSESAGGYSEGPRVQFLMIPSYAVRSGILHWNVEGRVKNANCLFVVFSGPKSRRFFTSSGK